jgi:thymidine kinase
MDTYPYRSMVTPPAKHLWWSEAQNQMGHVTYVTGPAGSGKTTGLFSNTNWAVVRGQSLWNENTVFATLTNNLANTITPNVDMPGARGRTIFNFCNRKIAEKEGQLASPTQRSRKYTNNRAYNMKQTSLMRSNKLKSRSLARYSTVVLDECNYNQITEFRDAIEVAGAHHFYIVVICDYDDQMDCFKQLHGINYELNIKSPSYMHSVISGSLGPSIHSGRIELVDVHRQKDPLLKNLLSKMRGMSGDEKSQLTLFESLCVSPEPVELPIPSLPSRWIPTPTSYQGSPFSCSTRTAFRR